MHIKPTASGGPTCRSQDVRGPREARPSRRTLRRHVSRQVLVELRSHNSRGLLVDRRPTLARVHSAFLPRLEIHPRNPRNGRLRLWRPRLHPRGMGRTCRSQARHDDAHQPGDHSRLWNVARRNIRPLRDRSLVGTRVADHDHGPRPLAGNASHFPGSWRAQCTRRAAPGHCRTRKRERDSNRSNL